MLTATAIYVLWTWQLTPLWVNILSTVLLSMRAMLKLFKAISDLE